MKPSTSERSPLSPTPSPPDGFVWWRSLIFLGAVLLAAGIGIVFGAVFARAPGPATHAFPTTLTWGITLGQLASYVPILAVVFTLLPWTAGRSLGDLGWRGPNARALTAALVGAVAMYAVTVIVAGVQYAFTHSQPHEEAVTLFTSTHDPALLATFTLIAIVAAPIVEEFIFRGFLFSALRRYAPVWAAAALSGLLFGLSHFSPSALAPLACSGIVLAYVYYMSESLVASMITHALFNALNLVALATGHT